MMRILRKALALLLLVPALGCVRKTEPEPVTIGHFAPLGRPDRRGEHARQGVALAVEELLAGGQRLAGRTVTVLHVEGGNDAEAIRAETTRLITVNKAAALMAGPDSEAADRLVRAAEPYGLPVVVPCELADTPVIGAVCLAPAPADRGKALARFASGELKVQQAALVPDTRSPIAAAVAAGFRSDWPRGEDRLNGEWTYQKDSNRQDLVQRVLKSGPGAVVIAGEGRDFFPLVEQFRRTGLDKPVLYAGPDEGVAPLLLQAPAEVDFYLITVYPGETPGDEAFLQAYQQRFHEKPNLFAAQAYDATRLLLESLEKAHAAQPERLLDQLRSWETFPTRTGPLTWKKGRAQRPLSVVHVQNGKAKIVGTVEPEK
jgi:branched-chain amino acid transport system substrate-binding protein